MRAHDDPALEIRRALDREVERSFDAARLSRAIDAQFPKASRSARSGGPLSRVPAPVQWIGIAAAVVAAVTGVLSLFVERTTQHPVEERPVSVMPAAPVLEEPKVEPRPLPASPPPRPRPEVRMQPAPVVAEKESAPIAPPEAPPKPPRPVAPAEERLAQPQVARAVSPPPRIPASAETQQRVASTLPSTAPLVVHEPVPAVSRSGVEVRWVGWAGRHLVPRVDEVTDIGATLIRVTGRRGDARPFRPTRRPQRTAMSPAGDAAKPPVDYYVRVLHGLAIRPAFADEHGIVTKSVRVEPLGEMEAWGNEDHEAYLRRVFLLSSVVALDGVHLERPEEDGSSQEGTLIVTTGDRVYTVAVSAGPDESEGRHTFEIALSTEGHRSKEKLEAVIALGEEEVAVLAVPDLLLDGGRERNDRAPTDTTFVVVSPRLAEAPRSGRGGERFLEKPDEPPILIDAQATRARKAGGPKDLAVRLRAVVRADGSVGRVEILELPDVAGAEEWIATISAQVREWRYLPARHEGEPVATYVTIELELEDPGSAGPPRDGDR